MLTSSRSGYRVKQGSPPSSIHTAHQSVCYIKADDPDLPVSRLQVWWHWHITCAQWNFMAKVSALKVPQLVWGAAAGDLGIRTDLKCVPHMKHEVL